MSQLFPTNLPYKVADMSLAEFGRKEITKSTTIIELIIFHFYLSTKKFVR